MTYKQAIPTVALALMILTACVSPLAAAPGDAPAGDAPKAAPKLEPKAAPAPEPKPAADEKPATQPAKPKEDTIIVTAVTGLAQSRVSSDAKAQWQRVTVGDILTDLTVIRTGLGTTVVVRLGDRGEVTIKSGTKVGIKEFSKKAGLASVRLGLKYGAMRARVDSSKGKKNDFRVSTPVATLSVRGSSGQLGFSGDMGFGFHVAAGNWHADFGMGPMRNAEYREWLTGAGRYSSRFANRRRNPGIGDPHGGLTPAEIVASRTNSGGRGGGFNGGGTGVGGGVGSTGSPPLMEGPSGRGEAPTGEGGPFHDYSKWR